MSAAGKDPAEQDCSVDGRDFGVPDALTRVDVGPVIKETAVVREFGRHELQSGDNTLPGFRARQKTAAVSDAERGEAKTGGSNAGNAGVVRSSQACITSVLDKAILGIRLLPKEATAGSLDVVEKLIVFRREWRRGFRCSGGHCAERMRKW